jgi:hypothetical protein
MLDDETPYQDPTVDALREQAKQLGLRLRLTHLGTRGQLAFAVPVGGLDYWRATLHTDDGKRVASELRNTAKDAARAALTAARRSSR